LNSLERIRLAVAHREPDVIPVGPYVANHAARLAGINLRTYCTNGKEMARAQLEAWDRYQYDIIFPDCDNYYIAEGFGCAINLPEDNVAELIRPPLERLDQVDDLKTPNPKRDGRMPVVLEAIEIIAQQVGDEAVIRVPGTGPFSMASYLIGMEAFLLELAKIEYGEADANPHAVGQMLELTTRTLIEFGLAEIESGAQIVQCGDSLASIDVISPGMYAKYALPYEHRVFSAWKAKGAITLLHICGNSTPVLEQYARTGADIVELDSKVDLRLAKERIGDKVCLCGNLNPVELLTKSSTEIERASEECIRQGGAGGGYILGTGCEVPVGTPPQNIRAIVDTGRRHSYPLGN
jgi:uroporphyrinogen decarboxylase